MKTWICALTALAAWPAGAHEGHGTSSAASLVHYIAEPAHAAPLLLVVAAALVWRLAPRLRSAQPRRQATRAATRSRRNP